MNIKTWPRTATSMATLAVLLSACGGGGDAPPPAPPTPTATKLNSDNAMDAAGVASLALQRAQVEVTQVIGATLSHHLQQTPVGVHACAAGGQVVVARPTADVTRVLVDMCDTGAVLLRSGEVQIDTGVADVGFRFGFKDLSYADSGKPAMAAQLLNGRFDSNIKATTDLARRSAGELSVASNGRTDQYPEVYIANKASDDRFLQYGVKLRSPRFAHELNVVLDSASKTATLQADDGSVLSLVIQPSGGAMLELRPAAGAAVSFSRAVSRAELDGAVDRARQ